MEIEVTLQNDRCAMMTNIVDDVPDDNEVLMRLCLTRTDMEVSTVHKQIDLENTLGGNLELDR